ncbi:MAG: hypothetical protein DI636_11195 [Pelagerythrobacter marensis]|nr:MAG: hypothetical protein DI636_11195 [Pelagerythrobacter marensis]
MPDRSPQIRVTAMPTDLNPYGGVFGGWLMVGDELSVYCDVQATGTTSLTIAAEAIARERHGEAETTVARGTFKFVLLDETDRPRAVGA